MANQHHTALLPQQTGLVVQVMNRVWMLLLTDLAMFADT